jgi:hypothetical protein
MLWPLERTKYRFIRGGDPHLTTHSVALLSRIERRQDAVGPPLELRAFVNACTTPLLDKNGPQPQLVKQALDSR